jgi:carnitine O-acetyltransferase
MRGRTHRPALRHRRLPRKPLLLAQSINPSTPTLFHAPLFPYARSYKGLPAPPANVNTTIVNTTIDATPKKLEWTLSPELGVASRFAEPRLSDLILQNYCLSFRAIGRISSRAMGFRPMRLFRWRFRRRILGFRVSRYALALFPLSLLVT